jgi:hypothetical protein
MFVAMRKMRIFAVMVAILGIAACATPPQAEMDAAKAALENAARSADVVTYAPDALRAAQEKIVALDAEIAAQAKRSALSRNYDAAKQLAAEAARLAQAALDTAVTAKQQVAKDAAALVDELTAALPDFQSKVWAAKRVPRIKIDIINPLQSAPEQIRTGLIDAQKDIDSGAYATAKAKLTALSDTIRADEETITEQTRIARGR